MAIEAQVLFTPDCANAEPARDAVARVARAAGVAVEIIAIPVRDVGEAKRLRFPGSPTVRVAGQDVDPRAEALDDFGLG